MYLTSCKVVFFLLFSLLLLQVFIGQQRCALATASMFHPLSPAANRRDTCYQRERQNHEKAQCVLFFLCSLHSTCALRGYEHDSRLSTPFSQSALQHAAMMSDIIDEHLPSAT